MPLLLRRRQEPKSARRMCPFMSSRTLSGLTSLGGRGREHEGSGSCTWMWLGHMPTCVCMSMCTHKQYVCMRVGGGSLVARKEEGG